MLAAPKNSSGSSFLSGLKEQRRWVEEGLTQVFLDFQTACTRPPSTFQQRQRLFYRMSRYGIRFQFFCWNLFGVGALHLFGDTLLTEWWNAGDALSLFLFVLYHVLGLTGMALYYKTTFTDPGFVPLHTEEEREAFMRQALLEDAELEDKGSVDSESKKGTIGDFLDVKSMDDETDETATLIEVVTASGKQKPIARVSGTGGNVPPHFCWKCKFIRPIRSKHCYQCERCVARFDHHCPMVANCIGGYNHRFFVAFLTLEVFFVIWSELMCANTCLNSDSFEHRSVVGWLFRAVFLLLVGFGCCISVSLSSFHIYLCFTGQTTYEMMKPQVLESYLFPEHFHQEMHKLTPRSNTVAVPTLAQMQSVVSASDEKQPSPAPITEAPAVEMRSLLRSHEMDAVQSGVSTVTRRTQRTANGTRSAALSSSPKTATAAPKQESFAANTSAAAATQLGLKSFALSTEQLMSQSGVGSMPPYAQMVRAGIGMQETGTAANSVRSGLGTMAARRSSGMPPVERVLIRKGGRVPISSIRDGLRNYTDEGAFSNVLRFFRAEMKPEWFFPEPAVLDC